MLLVRRPSKVNEMLITLYVNTFCSVIMFHLPVYIVFISTRNAYLKVLQIQIFY